MNMNDKDWDGEFWDDEPDADDDGDDEHNGLANDIDANNDETFDNAAEWNEDEHEELIARDSILSQTNRTRRNNHNHAAPANSSNNGLDILNSISNNVNSNIRSQNTIGSSANDSSRNSSNKVGLNRAIIGGNSSRSTAGTSAWNASGDVNDFPSLLGSVTVNQAPSDAWPTAATANERLLQLQLQQQQMLLQSKLHNQEHLRQQQIRERQIQALQQQQREQLQTHQMNIIQQATAVAQSDSGPLILRVDDLERQLRKATISQVTPQQPIRVGDLSKRSGWSPFGGKDLFTSPDQDILQVQADLGTLLQQSQTMDLEQQQRLIIQQHQLLQRQQQQLQQLASLQQQHLQQQQQQQQQQQLQALQQQQQQQLQHLKRQQTSLLPQGKCLTVEELERQILADKKQPDRSEGIKSERPQQQQQQQQPQPEELYCFFAQAEQLSPNRHETSTKATDRQRNNHTQDRRNGDRHDRFGRHARDSVDPRDYKDRRDPRSNRENRYPSRGSIIIPPQVQRRVIDHAKKNNSIPKMQQYEFLQDKMPTVSEGFRMREHSKVASEKVKHDGVLTEKERNWLTRIQEKIQADYDDKLDQDYYYLLYFNRSSMTNEAAQKPVGPGVSDRRFIPRERLLYNSGV